MNPELRGDAEKTFDIEQAAAEGAEFEREYLAEVAEEQAEQATRPTIAARYDITIRGAVLRELPDPEEDPTAELHSFTYTRPGAGTDPEWMSVNLGSPDVSIAPAAPVGWPPLVGDLWGGVGPNGSGRLMAVDAVADLGEPADELVHDSGAAYPPDEARAKFGPLRLLYRNGGDGDD